MRFSFNNIIATIFAVFESLVWAIVLSAVTVGFEADFDFIHVNAHASFEHSFLYYFVVAVSGCFFLISSGKVFANRKLRRLENFLYMR